MVIDGRVEHRRGEEAQPLADNSGLRREGVHGIGKRQGISTGRAFQEKNWQGGGERVSMAGGRREATFSQLAMLTPQVAPEGVESGTCVTARRDRPCPSYALSHHHTFDFLTPQVGPKDVESGTCVTARRDRPGKEGKQMGVPMAPDAFVTHLKGLLDEVGIKSGRCGSGVYGF